MLAVWVIVFAVPGAAGIGAPLVPDGGRDEPRKTAKGGKPLAYKSAAGKFLEGGMTQGCLVL